MSLTGGLYVVICRRTAWSVSVTVIVTVLPADRSRALAAGSVMNQAVQLISPGNNWLMTSRHVTLPTMPLA